MSPGRSGPPSAVLLTRPSWRLRGHSEELSGATSSCRVGKIHTRRRVSVSPLTGRRAHGPPRRHASFCRQLERFQLAAVGRTGRQFRLRGDPGEIVGGGAAATGRLPRHPARRRLSRFGLIGRYLRLSRRISEHPGRMESSQDDAATAGLGTNNDRSWGIVTCEPTVRISARIL